MELQFMKQTLEYYRKEREKLVVEITPQLDKIRGFDAMIQQLARDLNEPANIDPVLIESASSISTGAVPAVLANGNGNKATRTTLRPDEFFGMSQSDAAKAYLKMVGRAISMDELVGALQSGGAQVGGVDPKRTLQVSLKANPKKEFVWPNKDTIGLAEFYTKRK